MIKTKEEILDDCSVDTTTKGRVRYVDGLCAMDEWHQQQLSEYKEKLKAEIERIKDRTSPHDDGVANGYNIGLSQVLILIDKI